MERMLEALGPKGARAWEFLEAVLDSRLTLGQLFDAYRMNDLDGLRATLQDVDLRDHVAGWQGWLRDRVGASSQERYLAHLRTLVPDAAPFWRSGFTGPAVAHWLASRTRLVQKRRPSPTHPRARGPELPRPISGATRRKYLAAVQSFSRYLRTMGVLDHDPLAGIAAPPPAPPRLVVIELPEVLRIVQGARDGYRPLFALLYGSGVEISAALGLTRRDVDPKHREVRARGTKTHTRDRIVRVADWAWPIFAEALGGVLPGAKLFPGLDRWRVGDEHRAHLKALGLDHHRLHDARHFYAVRAVKAGTPYELVARQLGHADVQMVAKVYGRFAPGFQDRDRWERIASARDEELYAIAGGQCTKSVPKGEEPAGVLSFTGGVSRGAETASPNSRGGTRTRDPGIMSAVL